MYRSLNLDGMFIPTPLPEIEFNLFKFSGGEVHIKLNNNIDYEQITNVVITNRITNSDDLIKILIAKDALERKGIKKFELIIPYFPYARQDRVCVEGESFTLKVFTDILNTLKFDKIYVLDAHSNVSVGLLNNCINLSNQIYVEKAVNDIKRISNKKDIILVSPDSGANKKSNDLFFNLKCFKSIVKCDKIRNLDNGNLNGFEVFKDDLNGETCLIVDDICDGGRTFIGIVESLKNKNVGDVYLFVTHGIFSNGFEDLGKYFNKIYTTNSFKDVEDDIVKQFKIQI